jgi:hypothetical protein
MSTRANTLLGLILLVGAGCSPDRPLAPVAETSSASAATRLGVLSRNLYVGTDLDAVLTALTSSSPEDDFPALLSAIATLEETHFPARAEAFADEIARTRPHVVGLQEVSTVDIDLTGLGIPVTVQLDFLSTLLDELSERGLDYTVGAAVENITADPIPGISLLDRDVLLVDPNRVEVLSKVEANFLHSIGPVAPGVVLRRGWVSVTAEVDGGALTVVNTHLESGESSQLAQLRAAQAAELVAALGDAAPVILLGDLNDVPGSLMYQVVTGAGFSDAWAALRPGAIGHTCCHLPDLSNPVAAFHERIDYIMTRGLEGPGGLLLGQIDRLGDLPSSLVAGPEHAIWPSDHAGLLADFLQP